MREQVHFYGREKGKRCSWTLAGHAVLFWVCSHHDGSWHHYNERHGEQIAHAQSNLEIKAPLAVSLHMLSALPKERLRAVSILASLPSRSRRSWRRADILRVSRLLVSFHVLLALF